jgi:hypothetical protein
MPRRRNKPPPPTCKCIEIVVPNLISLDETTQNWISERVVVMDLCEMCVRRLGFKMGRNISNYTNVIGPLERLA